MQKKNKPLLLPHLLKRIRKVPAAYLLAVLELQKLFSPVPGHVYEHVAPRIASQPLPPRYVFTQPICEQPYEILHGDFIAPVVDLYVVAVEVQRSIRVVVYRAGEGVARVAGHVVGEHEDDL